LDDESLGHLANLSVYCTSGWQDESASLVSPITHYYPYGFYDTTFSKANYIDGGVMNWSADSDKTLVAYLTSTTSLLTKWDIVSELAYDSENDVVVISSWIERGGKLQEDPTSVIINIYDQDGNEITTLTSFAHVGGVFWNKWDVSNVPGGVYSIRTTIEFHARTYTGMITYDLAAHKRAVEAAETEAAFRAQTQAELVELGEKVEEIPEEITPVITQAVESGVTEITAETSKILTATEETIPAKITETREKVEDVLRSEILNQITTIKIGEKLVIRYRTYSGLSPTIDVYNPQDEKVISEGLMKEVGDTQIYEYPVTFSHAWGVGDFTVVCSESTKGTMDAIVITVVRHDIEEVAGQVSAVMGTTASLGNIRAVITTLNAQINLIETALTKISTDIVTQAQGAAAAMSDLDTVYNQLVNMSAQIKDMAVAQSPQLEKLYKVSKEGKQDLKYLKNKTQELKAVVELNNKLISNITNKPVTQVWFEFH
jgi:hypothetical protein